MMRRGAGRRHKVKRHGRLSSLAERPASPHPLEEGLAEFVRLGNTLPNLLPPTSGPSQGEGASPRRVARWCYSLVARAGGRM